MNLLKNIAGRAMAFWALLVFTITLLVFVLPISLAGLWPEPKRSHVFYSVNIIWMRLFFILIGVRRSIRGRENFIKGQNYVVICNHRSLMDPPLASPAIPSANKTIAKAGMAKIPLFGIPYKRGSILVDRKSEESRRSSYSKMKEVLAQGLHMCIYPEGTRNKTAEPLQRFHDGAFRLAIDAKKRIIPALLFNTATVLPRKPFFFWPAKVAMHFLTPIDVEGKSVDQLRKEAFEVMKAYYTANKQLDKS